MAIEGPNDMEYYQGEIRILNSTSLIFEESDETYTFAFQLVNSTKYCQIWYQTVGATAISGLDFIPTDGSLIWEKDDGIIGSEYNIQTVSITLKDDDEWEIENKTLFLMIYKNYGVAVPDSFIKITIKDNDGPPSNCSLTNWTNWSNCSIERGTMRLYRSRIAAIQDDFYRLHCRNISESKYCVNTQETEPGIMIMPNQIEVESESNIDKVYELSLMLQTPPNLTSDLGYDPYPLGEQHIICEISLEHEQLQIYPPSVTFRTLSWAIPATLYVRVLDNNVYNGKVYVIEPIIIVQSADPNYMGLNESQKSILGPVRFIVHDDEKPPETQQDWLSMTFYGIKVYTIVASCAGLIGFIAVIGRIRKCIKRYKMYVV